MGAFRFRHELRQTPAVPLLQRGDFKQTVQETAAILNKCHPIQAPDQYAKELCSMAAEWSKVWYEPCDMRLGDDYVRGTMPDHVLVAFAYFGMTAAFVSLLPSCQSKYPLSDHFGMAYYWAISRGHTPIVNVLRERSRPEEVPRHIADFGFDSFMVTTLALATRGGHLDLMKIFIEETKKQHHCTVLALRVAAETGQMDALQLLIDTAPLLARLRKWPLDVLLAAAEAGQVHVVDFAISKLGADVNGSLNRKVPEWTWWNIDDFRCRTAIYLAAAHGHLETVSYLLAKGADISGPWGHAIEPAVRRGYTRTVKLLMEAGADPHAEDVNDLYPRPPSPSLHKLMTVQA